MSNKQVERWLCLGFNCNKCPINIFDVLTKEIMDTLIVELEATEIYDKLSSLQKLNIEHKIFTVPEDQYNDLFLEDKNESCCSIYYIFFIKKELYKHTITELVSYVELDTI